MRRRILSRVSISILTVALVGPWAGRVRTNPQTPPAWITPEEQTRLAYGLAAKLPPGWTLTSGGLGHVPDGWRSLDLRTFEMHGKNAAQSFRVWFLPVDWIGIRQPDPVRTRTVYWEGVLMDRRYKTITVSDLAAIHEAVHATGMNTPSLINSGWGEGAALFKDRLTDIDQQTQELAGRFCSTSACVDEAAYSLIVLGVPAKTLTLNCAEHGAGVAQAFCASALGYWGGPESVRVLNALVSAVSTPPRVRWYAASALEKIADPTSGPSLLQGLQLTPDADRNSASAIASALGRIRYAPAGPALLARLAGERDRGEQILYAGLLADMRYAPAIPAIETLCEVTTISSDWMIAHISHGEPELALLRIKGPWGQPSDGIRLLILPPENPLASRPIQVAALIENAGDSDLVTGPGSSVGFLSIAGIWIVDGREYTNVDRPLFDGVMTLRVNGASVRSVDLSSLLSTPGTHSVQYRLLTAISNLLTIQVR